MICFFSVLFTISLPPRNPMSNCDILLYIQPQTIALGFSFSFSSLYICFLSPYSIEMLENFGIRLRDHVVLYFSQNCGNFVGTARKIIDIYLPLLVLGLCGPLKCKGFQLVWLAWWETSLSISTLISSLFYPLLLLVFTVIDDVPRASKEEVLNTQYLVAGFFCAFAVDWFALYPKYSLNDYISCLCSLLVPYNAIDDDWFM